ncbi:MAG: hypothetical protein KDB14_29770 [Planctomycetales bacterium]|nr:hypothetical protein [Planctomycetales bacterium]
MMTSTNRIKYIDLGRRHTWLMSGALLACGVALACPCRTSAQAPQGGELTIESLAAPPVANILPVTKAVYDDAVRELVTANKGMTMLLEAERDNRLADVTPNIFTTTHGALIGVRRRSSWLTEFGDPAGVELSRRGNALMKRFRALLTNYNNTSRKAQAFLENTTQPFGANANSRNQQYAQAMRLAQAGKAVETELFILKSVQGWMPKIGLLADIGHYTKGFEQARLIAAPVAQQQRHQAGQEGLAALLKSVWPQVPAVLDDTDKVVAEIGAAGQATRGTEQMDGPAAFSYLCRNWFVTHENLQKAEAVEMALSSLEGNSPSERLEQIRTERKTLAQRMAQGLAELVRADSNRATSETFDKYLATAANLQIRATSGALRELDRALLALGDKLHQNRVSALGEALDELLYWREKSAEARAKAQAREYPSAQAALIVAARSASGLAGLLPAANLGSPDQSPRFLGSSPEVVTLVEPGGKRITLERVGPSTGATRVSQLHDRMFATMPSNVELSEPLELLKADLLVSDATPPLTLTTASSLAAAQAGCFDRCGGSVKAIYPNSLIVTRLTWPQLLPLGPPLIEDVPNFQEQAVLQVDLQPEWWQHSHFFVKPADASPQS